MSHLPWNNEDVQNFIVFVQRRGGTVKQVYSTSGGYVFDVVAPREGNLVAEGGEPINTWAGETMRAFEQRERRP